jgi:4-hydroxy-tetrahydrodipicolinate reductase
MPGIAVFGINGRMGQAIIRALHEATSSEAGGAPSSCGAATGFRLSGAIASPHSRRLGEDAAADGTLTGVAVTADAQVGLAGAAVALDFSLAAGVAAHAEACSRARIPLLVGTTGLDAATRRVLETAAGVIPVLIAPNTSVGVNLVLRLVKMATLALGPGYDVEVSEAHHRQKRDAPSGTALALGEAVAGVRGQALADVAVFDRQSDARARLATDIGFSVVRAGDIVGEHTVSFAAAGERVEITHRATDRMTFARGALRAAEWLEARPPGLYQMDDVLGIQQA